MSDTSSRIHSEPPGLTIEHIMLSIDVISTQESAGKFDDSAASIISRELRHYHGVMHVRVEVLYKHTKIEQHLLGCECIYCVLNRPMPEAAYPPHTVEDVEPTK